MPDGVDNQSAKLHRARPSRRLGIKFAAALLAGTCARSRGASGDVCEPLVHFALILDPLIPIEQQAQDFPVEQFFLQQPRRVFDRFEPPMQFGARWVGRFPFNRITQHVTQRPERRHQRCGHSAAGHGWLGLGNVLALRHNFQPAVLRNWITLPSMRTAVRSATASAAASKTASAAWT